MKIGLYHTFNPKLGILILSTTEEIFIGKDLCQHVLSINSFHGEEEWYLFICLFTIPSSKIYRVCIMNNVECHFFEIHSQIEKTNMKLMNNYAIRTKRTMGLQRIKCLGENKLCLEQWGAFRKVFTKKGRYRMIYKRLAKFPQTEVKCLSLNAFLLFL